MFEMLQEMNKQLKVRSEMQRQAHFKTGSGAHGSTKKTKKAERRKAKQKLHKQLRDY